MRKWCARFLQPAPHDLALLVLVIALAVSLAITPDLGRTLRAAWPLLAGILLCGLIARWPHTRARLIGVWYGLILAEGGMCLLGLMGMKAKAHVLWPQLQQVLTALLAARDELFGSTLNLFHPNVVAGSLVVLLPFCLAGALHSCTSTPSAWEEKVLVVLSAILWLVGCAVVILTQSRGAYLGLAAGMLTLALLWPRTLLVVLPAAAVGVGGVMLAEGWTKLGKLLALADPTFGLGWRSGVWANGLRIVASFPYTGVGLGCFRLVTATLFPMAGAGSVDASHAHNLYLQVAIDLGIPGLVAYLACLGLSFLLLAKAYRAWGRRHEAGLRLLAAASIAALVGMCVHGLVDVVVWGNKGAFLPWAIVGLSAALYHVSEQRA